MLEIDQSKRATLDDIINSDWVTNFGEEHLCLDHNHQEDDDKSVINFDNINRGIETGKKYRS